MPVGETTGPMGPRGAAAQPWSATVATTRPCLHEGARLAMKLEPGEGDHEDRGDRHRSAPEARRPENDHLLEESQRDLVQLRPSTRLHDLGPVDGAGRADPERHAHRSLGLAVKRSRKETRPHEVEHGRWV